MQEAAVKQHTDDRAVYKRHKDGAPLSKAEHDRVDRYRETRARLRGARASSGGISLMAKLDFVVYLAFAAAFCFALKHEYGFDVVPHILNFFRPKFDHLDEQGNWKAHADEL